MTRNLVIIIRLVVFPCLVLATNAVGGRGYEAPPILNFDTRWRKVVSSTLCPYYRRGNYHGTHRWGAEGITTVGREKFHQLQGNEFYCPVTSGRTACTPDCHTRNFI